MNTNIKFTALSSCVYTKAPTSGPVMVVLVSGLIDQPGSRSPLAPLRHSTAPHEASCQASVPASASSQSPHPLLAMHITSNPSNQESYLPVSEFLQSFTAAVALKLKKDVTSSAAAGILSPLTPASDILPTQPQPPLQHTTSNFPLKGSNVQTQKHMLVLFSENEILI